MTALAITVRSGVEMKRPGLGDLAGRGAACGSHPDLRKCSRHHHITLIIHRLCTDATKLRVRIRLLPSSADRPHAALALRRVASSGHRQDLCHHGAPTGSAQRERPGARKGAADLLGPLSEVGDGMRLQTDTRHGGPRAFARVGAAVRLLTTEQHRTGSECHDNG